jgi:hypothetical protein
VDILCEDYVLSLAIGESERTINSVARKSFGLPLKMPDREQLLAIGMHNGRIDIYSVFTRAINMSDEHTITLTFGKYLTIHTYI